MKITIRQLLTVILITNSTFMIAQSAVEKNKIPLYTDIVDPFLDAVIKSTHLYYSDYGPGQITFCVSRGGPIYFLNIASTSHKCVGGIDNYVIILFTDGSKLFLNKDQSEEDCSGKKLSRYIIDKQWFYGKTIDQIRVHQKDGTTTAYYTCEYSIAELIDALE